MGLTFQSTTKRNTVKFCQIGLAEFDSPPPQKTTFSLSDITKWPISFLDGSRQDNFVSTLSQAPSHSSQKTTCTRRPTANWMKVKHWVKAFSVLYIHLDTYLVLGTTADVYDSNYLERESVPVQTSVLEAFGVITFLSSHFTVFCCTTDKSTTLSIHSGFPILLK